MRRADFLKALLVVPLAAKAVVLAASRVPRLWGDGVHDDAPAIQAMLDNDGVCVLPTGDYLLGSTVTMKAGTSLIGSGSRFTARKGFKGYSMFSVERAESLRGFNDNTLDGRQVSFGALRA